MARPTIYNEQILLDTQAYINSCEDKEAISENGVTTKAKVNLPSVEGLAYHLHINKDTINEWCKIHPEFSVIIDDLRHKQARSLINNGLSGDYNPTIAKVLLAKHGYKDSSEVDHSNKGDKFGSPLSEENQEALATILKTWEKPISP